MQASSPQLATLLRVEPKLIPAQKASGSEWKRWWWVCAAGQLVFLVLVFFMRGRWSPRAAKADFDEHERLVAAELDKLRGQEPVETWRGIRRWRRPVPRMARCGCASDPIAPCRIWTSHHHFQGEEAGGPWRCSHQS